MWAKAMAASPDRLLNSSALQELSTMPEADFEESAKRFLRDDHVVTIRSKILLERLSTAFENEEYARALSTQLIAIATIRRIEAIDIEKAYDRIVDSMKLNGVDSDAQNWFRRVRQSFLGLLNGTSVRLVAKALHLSTDYSEVFLNANVVTDIRPVFSNPRDEVVGGVVTQTLRVHFITGDRDMQEQEISLALDADDIEKLIIELTKAKNKSSAVKEFLSSAIEDNYFVVGEETYGFD